MWFKKKKEHVDCWHEWGNWSKAKDVTNRTIWEGKNKSVVEQRLYQFRTCKKCNVILARQVY